MEDFSSYIEAQINYLFTHCPHTIKIEQLRSGNKCDPRCLDRFTLVIPYCLDTIKWDIIYNSDYPMLPPDVMFGQDDDDFHPLHSTCYEGVEHSTQLENVLSDWSSKDSTQLLALIQELRDQYMNFQRKRVGRVKDDRLIFELSTILSREYTVDALPALVDNKKNFLLAGLPEPLSGIEMHMSSGVDKVEEVKFAVPLLDLNINKMVAGCPWKHQQKIYLQVVFPVSQKYESVPSAPRLKLISTHDMKALFSVDEVKLPPWVNAMCLAEYLPHLEETLGRQVLEAVSLIEVRRHFIEALVPHFGNPLEADPIFCRKAVFLASSGPFVFMVYFSLPTQFPKQQPAVMFQSSQHFNSANVPLKSQLLNDYPWSPRWEISHMAERTFEFLVDESLKFKKYCSEAPSQQ